MIPILDIPLHPCAISRLRAHVVTRTETLPMAKPPSPFVFRFGLLVALSGAVTNGMTQDVREDVLTRDWAKSSYEQRVAAINLGLGHPSDQRKTLALQAISLLAAEDRAAAMEQFTPNSIRVYLLSKDQDVSRTAARAYFAVSESDASAESDLVAMIRSGELPAPPVEYIRYLRTGGITSDAARSWLLSLSAGPVSAEKYAAVHALVVNSLAGGNETPLPSLLPHVMALIRSPEFFCDYTLVRSPEKFGHPAAQHLDELLALRARLVSEANVPADDRSFVLRTEPDMSLAAIDEVVSRLRR